MERAEQIINNAANKKQGQKKYGNVSVKMNSSLEFIEHIWAKNGEVYYKTRQGKTGHMSPDEAIKMANQINNDITRFSQRPDVKQGSDLNTLKKKRDELVGKLIKAYRKAGQQRKNPDNKADELLSYAWHGKNRHGEPFTAQNTFSDQLLEQKKKEYEFLDEEDILQFLKSPNLDPHEAERMLKAENEKRALHHYNPELAHKGMI